MPNLARPPLPPFDEASARQKVLMAEAAWKPCDPERVASAYTIDSVWRNRSEFDEHGLRRRREASIDDVLITATERRIFGPRPDVETSGLPLR